MNVPSLRGILETSLYADDLEAAREFYTKVLGLEMIGESKGRHVFFRCGEGVLLLFNPEETAINVTKVKGAMVPLHGSRGVGHVAFGVPEDEVLRWKGHLISHDVSIESEVTWPNGGESIYFRDPAGNSLEITSPSIWRQSN